MKTIWRLVHSSAKATAKGAAWVAAWAAAHPDEVQAVENVVIAVVKARAGK